MGAKCRKYSACSLSLIGVVLLLVGIIVVALGSFKTLAEDKIKERLPLKSGSKSFKNWEKPDTRLRKYYMFNMTNIKTGSLPIVKQLGPYTYRKLLSYTVTSQEDGAITYIPTVEYIFDKDESCSKCNPEKDILTTVNYPVLILVNAVSLRINGSKSAANSVVGLLNQHGIGMFQKRSVHEMLWGYKDETFSQVATIILKSKVGERYALQKNNSGSGVAKIYSGENDVEKVAEYISWMNFPELPFWSSSSANMVNGTDGSRFKPLIEKDDELFIFVTEICRSVKLIYDAPVAVDGINLYRFTIPKEAFESGNINTNNEGFCVTGPRNKCLKTGLLDINACRGGPLKAPPVVASFPNFYLGDPSLSKAFDMAPQKSTDQTYLDVEPNTGLTMRFNKRLQVNMAISNFSLLNILLNVDTSNPVYLPIFYTDESARISEDDADKFKKQVLVPLRAAQAAPYGFIGAGAVCTLIAIIIIVIHFLRK